MEFDNDDSSSFASESDITTEIDMIDLFNSVNDLIYDPDEEPENKSKFVLGLCEQLNYVLHGPLEKNLSNNIVSDKFLTIFRFKPSNLDLLNVFAINYSDFRMKVYDEFLMFNNEAVVYDDLNLELIKPEIISVYYVDDYCLAVKKTIWIKLIQRAWKKAYAKRIQIMKMPSTLIYRQTHGYWPKMPNLVGMLSGLSRR